MVTSVANSAVQVYEHGAHVTSWVAGAAGEQLFLSSLAAFAPPKAIRGGIPICFPQVRGPCCSPAHAG